MRAGVERNLSLVALPSEHTTIAPDLLDRSFGHKLDRETPSSI